MSRLVEKEKMKAIGSRNAVKSSQKQVEGQVLQLKALYLEKQMELDRLRRQYDSLIKKEGEQTEFIQQFMAHK
jgi:intraflagellar transport protein 20